MKVRPIFLVQLLTQERNLRIAASTENTASRSARSGQKQRSIMG